MVVYNHTSTIIKKPLSESADIWHRTFNTLESPMPFLSYEWFVELSTHLLHKDPDILLFCSEDHVIGILPVQFKAGTLCLLGDERVTDFTDILIEPGYEDAVMEAFADYIQNQHLTIDLHPLDRTSILLERLPAYLEHTTIESCDVCPYLELAATWEQYLKTLSGKLRHELRRKMRRAEAITLHELPTDNINILFDLMAGSDESKQSFLTDAIRSFFLGIANSFSSKNWLRLRAACLKNIPVAALISYVSSDRIYLYNLGFNRMYTDMSPGINAIAMDIKAAIREGYRYYDFLRGEEDYKYRLGATNRTTMRLTT